jgi:ribose 5-phosphate isomerase B
MKIAIGCDHGGYILKEKLITYLKEKGHNVIDAGCYCSQSCDYSLYALKTAELVSKKIADRGILICKSGIGNTIAANKVKGVRAALCGNVSQARLSRQHNDANILSLGALYVDEKLAKRMLSVWLKAGFLAGRHARRIRQITAYEKKHRAAVKSSPRHKSS